MVPAQCAGLNEGPGTMRVETLSWPGAAGPGAGPICRDTSLLLYFANRAAMQDGRCQEALRSRFPAAAVIGCSTGGHGLSDDIQDEGGVAAAIRFDSTRIRLVHEDAAAPAASHACGRRLGARLADPDLAGVLLLSDGLHLNGSALAAGLSEALGGEVPVSGGMAGDGAAFGATLVGVSGAAPAERRVAAIGFYGPAIRIHHGTGGGWERFGPERRITRAEGSLLFELDGAPALDLYERYLGEEAAGLPGTALIYPLRIWDPRRPDSAVVRTVLGVDRGARSMTFAGDMPAGWRAQLMRGGIDRLSAGAAEAARAAAELAPDPAGPGDSLAILISCIGRRLLMGQRTGEEIESVTGNLDPGTRLIAFYSYGELAPGREAGGAAPGRGACELHNQTMTITLLREAP